MPRHRRRPLRVLAVLALVLLALLLLELNRFFPGAWLGGGGDAGLRKRPSGESADPASVRPPETPPVPPEPEKGTIRVVVRGPGGEPLAGGRVALRGAGAPVALERGEALFRGVDAPPTGFSVADAGGARLAHGPPPSERSFVVQWPRSPLPAAAAAAGPRPIEVTDADGKPVAGAKIDLVLPGGREAALVTDAAGRAQVPAGAGVVRACVEWGDGRVETCVYASSDAPGPLAIRLPREVDAGTSFRDPTTGEALSAAALRLVDLATGEARPLPPPDGGWKRFDLRLPEDAAARQALEIEVADRPPLRVPLRALAAATDVPRGKRVEVVVRDVDGKPVAGARVSGRWSAEVNAEAGSGTVGVARATDAEGRAVLPLPDDRPADVVVEPEGAAAAGQTLAAPDGTAPVDVVIEEGVRVPVRVRGAGGAPVVGAEVVCLARAGRTGTRRVARTDADGRADLAPVAAGTVEVFARAEGFAWASASVAAARGMGTVSLDLEPGAPLRLVVEDPWGVPIAGVRVHSQARAESDAGVPAAAGPDEAPWVTNDDGVLVVPDLPDRALDLHLAKPGYRAEVVPRVRPGAATWFATLVPER